ncbi:LD-carboxypeptidase [Lentzea sp. NBC_00516]|uniref:S66 peptidase family protein n=1 Tax=Lentzea sp. NBC_00516 TaxID=2903582 RepID=UPI002E80006C|nr:LD-carboxypeptidase [Lentzea sp. NBC_00516]WUD22737.1 LD-carboxypeptidase [Lentzea sp. NBC_00516]
MNVVLPPRVVAGDRVRLVSPASYPSEEELAESVRALESWGLVVEVGEHALDRHGYLAGRDSDRLADLDDAYRDPGVRAVIATRGGAGAYRIAGIHGFLAGARSAASTRSLLMETEPAVLRRDQEALTAAVQVGGVATGTLVGGHLGTVAWSVGAGLPDLDGAILFMEAPRAVGLGHVDRQLTQLVRSGSLRGLRGVALGRFPGFEDYVDREWTVLDVLRDRLEPLGVPVLGGIDVGHGDHPLSIALGPMAELDADAGTLTVGPAVR